MADLLRDFARGTARQLHILIPGFAVVVTVHGVFGAHIRPGTIGGFLTLFMLLVPAVYLLGLVVDALRGASFDQIRKLFNEDDPPADSPQASTYALYANLATVGAVLILLVLVAGWRWWTDQPARLGYVLLFLLIEYGLCGAALRALQQSLAPPARATAAKKTTKKKR